MPQVGFKKQFAPMVLSGEKPFTLRALRKDGHDAKAGQTLYMFTGLRTKQCQRIAEKPCRFAVTVTLGWRCVMVPTLGSYEHDHQLELFSRLDGFPNYEAFCQFHKVTPGMKPKPMRLVAWVTREELKQMLTL